MKDRQIDLFENVVSEEDIKNRSWNLLSDKEKEEIKKKCEERDVETRKLIEQKKEDLRSGKQSVVDILFEM
jgi:predicted Fe-S protein YdhL (DUF1289 family)